MVKYINGPVNYAKLKGKINGINKIIYIFFDKHYNVDEQTKCESFDSIDISYYLYRKIKKTTEPLDFFMEIRNSEFKNRPSIYKDNYISEVSKLFKTEFIIENNKVLTARSNSNVRLHYLDIRDFFDIFYVLKILEKIKEKTKLFIKGQIVDRTIIKSDINKIEEHIDKVLKLKEKIKSNGVIDTNKKISEYYLNKIINKYNNIQLRNSLVFFMDQEFIIYYKRFYDVIAKIKNKLIELIMDKSIEISNELEKLYNILNDVIVDIYSLFTDIYLLRRILEKDYIKNIMTYSGRQHSINYIYFLVKYCDFEIVKAEYYYEKSMADLNKKIKNANIMSDVYNLFIVPGEKTIQCIKNDDMNFEYINYFDDDREYFCKTLQDQKLNNI